jgi:UDP:flavonoid glycosyltransferase YjiC (YdhE family)
MPPIRIWDALATTIDGLFVQWGLGLRAESVRDATYLEVCPPALRPAGERIWPHSLDLRPLPGAGGGLPPVIDALPYRDTVHLTLGTVFNGNREVLSAALAGLLALDVNVIATVGPSVDPASFGPQPPHVLVARYLPHTFLLPRCKLVVSQGGAGVMFGALSHGLPQLVLPQGADQFSNAAAVVHAGAGLSLLPGEVNPVAVAAAVTRLGEEPSFAASAAWVQVEIASMSPPAAVVRSLTAVGAGMRG